MVTKAYRVACAAALVFAFGSPGTSQMAAKDRIMRPVDSAEVAIVRGTAHPLARPEFDQGRVNSELAINGALVFRLSSPQQADLEGLLRDQQNPSSPRFHQWLTPEQYADRFGMSRNDLRKVTSWLKSQGLTVEGFSRGRTEVYFSGSAGTVENAFRTEIHNYVVRGENHFANATVLSIPLSLVDVVLSVRGLDNFRPKPMSHVRVISGNGASPRFTSSISGNHFVNPNDFAVIYNLNPLYNASTPLDGTGVTIAVTGQSTLMPTTNASTENATTDLDNFRAASGLTAKDPVIKQVPNTGTPVFNRGDAVEADLDLEWSNAVAKNANVVFVFAGSGGSAFDAINYIVNQGLGFAQIISNSFGRCEPDIGQSSAVSLWQTVRQANSQGQTMTSATGDTGAADCEVDQPTTPTSATHGLAVDIPAGIPEVTGVGGTEFTGDGNVCPPNATCPVTTTCPNGNAPADSFWLGTCALTSPAATAQGPIPEMAWNDTSGANGLSASGGGASTFFAKPSWQTGTGVPADGARDVPDVALNASPNHDPYLICSEASAASQSPPLTSCTNGFRSSDNKTLTAVGGTSAGAPTFAGILALILQATKGTGLGNVNPMLYSLAASTPAAFHDITTGNNQVPCTAGTKNCPSGTTNIGFTAGAGYDLVTGLGSADAAQLETAWLAATPSADFLMDAQSSTVTPGVSGSSTINVTATNGFADTVNLTCTPSSTTAQISCSLNPTSVPLSSTSKVQTVTLSITTVAALGPLQAPHPGGIWFAASSGLFAAVLLGGTPSRRRWMGLLGLVLLATIVVAVGCGGGSGGGNVQQKQQGTPAGTYTITVTGTGANTGTAHSVAVGLTVQ
jgi:subtilase family serine protease